MKQLTRRWAPILLLSSLSAAVTTAAGAADFAAAFIETGVGERAIGMGSAYTAIADDASASYWNPAGLVYLDGKGVLASHQPLSLDRQHDSLSFGLSIRGELGFGLTWLHAGVNNITARDATGSPLGDIDDSNNAYIVSVGRAIGPRLAVGVTMKVIEQSIKVPLGSRTTTSTGKGNGFDLGIRYLLGGRSVVAAVVRSINTDLSWKVDRGTQQTSSTKDPLPTTLVVGASHRLRPGLLLAADVASNNVDTHLNAGAEWVVSPVLTLRGGFGGMGGDAGNLGSTTAGLTLSPMRNQLLQFHYLFATDPLGNGGRSALGIESRF